MNEIVKIIMQRDGLSELEATNLVEEVAQEIFNAIQVGNFQECEDIMASELGLEPDFIEYLLQ